jgi:hypothetical protein
MAQGGPGIDSAQVLLACRWRKLPQIAALVSLVLAMQTAHEGVGK